MNINDIDKLNQQEKRELAEKTNEPGILLILALDENEYVRIEVAENPFTPIESLKKLALDENEDVRFAFAWRNSKAKEILNSLLEDYVWTNFEEITDISITKLKRLHYHNAFEKIYEGLENAKEKGLELKPLDNTKKIEVGNN